MEKQKAERSLFCCICSSSNRLVIWQQLIAWSGDGDGDAAVCSGCWNKQDLVGIGWPRRECWWAPTLPPLPYHHLLLLIPTVGTSWWGSFEWCGLAVQTKGTGNKRGIVVLAWHMLQPPCVTFGARVFRWLERMAGTEEDRCSLYPIKSLIKKT